MKAIYICAMLLCALCEPGRADAKYIFVRPQCIIHEDKIINAPCQAGGKIVDLFTMPPDPCLAQMREAMQAMEPWLLKPKTSSTVNGREVWDLSEWHQVKQQWDAAKQQCWKEIK